MPHNSITSQDNNKDISQQDLLILYKKYKKEAPLKVLASELRCSVGAVHSMLNGGIEMGIRRKRILLKFYKKLEKEIDKI